jgi:hypothetical protein
VSRVKDKETGAVEVQGPDSACACASKGDLDLYCCLAKDVDVPCLCSWSEKMAGREGATERKEGLDGVVGGGGDGARDPIRCELDGHPWLQE